MQFGLADFPETARQRSMLERKEAKERQDQERVSKAKKVEAELEERLEAAKSELDLLDDQPEYENDQEIASLEENTKQIDISQRNTVALNCTAQTSMRYGLSIRGTSAVCSAYLLDLIKGGILSPSKIYLAVDPRKLRRARDRVLSQASERGNEKTTKDDIKCVMFDSRLDQTKVSLFNKETGKYYPDVVVEDHYTVTDGEGRFLVHLTKPSNKPHGTEDELEEEEQVANEEVEEGEEEDEEEPEDRERRERLEKIIDEDPKPASIVARMIYNWMRIHGVDKSVQCLAGDSTNSNTGWRNGVMAWLEKFLGRKVSWLICQLHTNELGLRHLFQELDGKTNSKTGWSGELGKLLPTVKDMEVNPNFEPLALGNLVELPKDIEDQLSTDQSILYKRVQAVRTGVLSKDVALLTGGSLVHSRWLTFASELCMLWMSKHGLTGELYDRLRTVVTYIVSVYAVLWFEIKMKNSWLDGPRHVLKHLECLRLQSQEVQKILLPYLKTSSWYAHSEPILQTMLASSNQDERNFAVDKILKMRGREDFGKSDPRKRKLPKMNIEATSLLDLIDWRRAHEPVLTLKLTRDEIKEFKSKPMEVPYFPGDTQAVERAVKEV